MARIRPSDFIRKHWLLVGILTSIFLAGIYPSLGANGGPLKPEYTVKYVAVTTIFFISGLSLRTDSLHRTLRQWKLHSFIQIFTFILVPIMIRLFVALLGWFDVNPWILRGLITVACMPPPVSSAVILTRAAQGNESGAIFNSVLGSFLGIFITPLSLLLNLGYTALVPIYSTFIQLTSTVLLPLIVGQYIRKFTTFRGYNLPLNAIGQASLLFIIYTTFCDTFLTPEMGLNASDILVTVFLVLLMQMVLTYLSFSVSSKLNGEFDAADVVAITFCSTHKSLTLGVPILRVIFHGYSHLSQISLPLLVYHPMQIILGGLVVTQMKDWVQGRPRKKLPV